MPTNGLTSLPTRIDSSIGGAKSDARPVTDLPKQYPAEQFERLANAVVDASRAVGTKDGLTPDALESKVGPRSLDFAVSITNADFVFDGALPGWVYSIPPNKRTVFYDISGFAPTDLVGIVLPAGMEGLTLAFHSAFGPPLPLVYLVPDGVLTGSPTPDTTEGQAFPVPIPISAFAGGSDVTGLVLTYRSGTWRFTQVKSYQAAALAGKANVLGVDNLEINNAVSPGNIPRLQIPGPNALGAWLPLCNGIQFGALPGGGSGGVSASAFPAGAVIEIDECNGGPSEFVLFGPPTDSYFAFIRLQNRNRYPLTFRPDDLAATVNGGAPGVGALLPDSVGAGPVVWVVWAAAGAWWVFPVYTQERPEVRPFAPSFDASTLPLASLPTDSTVLLNTAGGGSTSVLGEPPFDGYILNIFKISADSNPSSVDGGADDINFTGGSVPLPGSGAPGPLKWRLVFRGPGFGWFLA